MLMSYKKKNMSSWKPAAYQISIVLLSHPLFFNSTPIFGNIKAINLNEMSARTLINLQSPLWEQSCYLGNVAVPVHVCLKNGLVRPSALPLFLFPPSAYAIPIYQPQTPFCLKPPYISLSLTQ